jgi:hypothetical protein
LKFGIVLIGVLKFAGILLLGSVNNTLFFVFVLALYAVVCYVHINHTGYFFAHYNATSAFNKDYADFQSKGANLALERIHAFSTVQKLANLPIKLGGAPITIVESINEPTTESDVGIQYNYILQTKGVLEDSDIKFLIAGQSSNNQMILAEEARKHQMTMTNSLANVLV